MNEICEDVPVEQCEIVPHEECKQVIEKVPNKISKKVATVICNDTDDETENEDDIDIHTSITFSIYLIPQRYVLQVAAMNNIISCQMQY